jgi:uroporphyrinogen decarboxylase
MSINMNQWANNTFAQSSNLFFPLITYPGLQLTKKTISDMVTSGTVQFQCIEALAKRYPQMPAIPMSMDLSLEAEAFGSSVIFSDDEIPTIKDRIIHSYEQIKEVEIPEPNTPRLLEFIKAGKLATDANFGKPIFSGCIGPYSLAGRLIDITEIMTGILMYPDEVHLLLEKATNFIIAFLKKIKESGVNGVVMAEPAAGLLDAYSCDEFSSKYIKKIVNEIQSDEFMKYRSCQHCKNRNTRIY